MQQIETWRSQSDWKAFTSKNLAQARKAIERSKGMTRHVDKGGHRSPCFDAADSAWLLGYIDYLLAKEGLDG